MALGFVSGWWCALRVVNWRVIDKLNSVVGGCGGGGTPGPIPNPEAKPSSADGTALDRVWESRSPPTSNVRDRVPRRVTGGALSFPVLAGRMRRPLSGTPRSTLARGCDSSVPLPSRHHGLSTSGRRCPQIRRPLSAPCCRLEAGIAPEPVKARRVRHVRDAVTVVGTGSPPTIGARRLNDGDVQWRSSASPARSGGSTARPVAGCDGAELFVDVKCWRKLAENVVRHPASRAIRWSSRGRLYTREYEHEGQRRSGCEVEAHVVGRRPGPLLGRARRATRRDLPASPRRAGEPSSPESVGRTIGRRAAADAGRVTAAGAAEAGVEA